MTQDPDGRLDAMFAQARAAEHRPPDDLMARVMADAAAQTAARMVGQSAVQSEVQSAAQTAAQAAARTVGESAVQPAVPSARGMHAKGKPRPRSRGWSDLLSGLGGWPAFGGLVAATASGIWIGTVQPAALADWTAHTLGTGLTVDLVATDDPFGLAEE